MQEKTSVQDPYSKYCEADRLDTISKTERKTYTRAQILMRFRYRGLAGAPDGSLPTRLVTKDDQGHPVFLREPRMPENQAKPSASLLNEAIEPQVKNVERPQEEQWNFR